MDCLGLRKLMTTQCNYNVAYAHQFFATVVFDSDDDVTMTWMSGNHKLTATFVEFGDLLGYPYTGSRATRDERLHVVGQEYDK